MPEYRVLTEVPRSRFRLLVEEAAPDDRAEPVYEDEGVRPGQDKQQERRSHKEKQVNSTKRADAQDDRDKKRVEPDPRTSDYLELDAFRQNDRFQSHMHIQPWQAVKEALRLKENRGDCDQDLTTEERWAKTQTERHTGAKQRTGRHDEVGDKLGQKAQTARLRSDSIEDRGDSLSYLQGSSEQVEPIHASEASYVNGVRQQDREGSALPFYKDDLNRPGHVDDRNQTVRETRVVLEQPCRTANDARPNRIEGDEQDHEHLVSEPGSEIESALAKEEDQLVAFVTQVQEPLIERVDPKQGRRELIPQREVIEQIIEEKNDKLRSKISEYQHIEPCQAIENLRADQLEPDARDDLRLHAMTDTRDFPAEPTNLANLADHQLSSQTHFAKDSPGLQEVHERPDQREEFDGEPRQGCPNANGTRVAPAQHQDLEPAPVDRTTQQPDHDVGQRPDADREHKSMLLKEQRSVDERLLLTSYRQTDSHEREVQEEARPRTALTCVVPSGIADKMYEMGPLEPEALAFIEDRYGYLNEHARADNDVQIRAPDEIATTELLLHRQSICQERSERAQAQIELLEEADRQAKSLPHYFSYSTLTVEPDYETASFEVKGVEQAEWQRTEYPEALKKVVEERSADAIGDERVSPTRAKSSRPSESRQFVAILQRDIKHQENELERLDDEEPPPGQFCTITVSGFGWIVFLRLWEARTLEEFDYYDPDIPATPCAIQAIVKKDREYKLWLSRRERAETHLKETRQKEYEQDSSRGCDYEPDDFER